MTASALIRSGVLSEQSQARVDWKTRMFGWLVPRLVGSEPEWDQAFTVINAAMNKANSEGIEDSIEVLTRINAKMRAPSLVVAIDALTDLKRRNDKDRAENDAFGT